MMALSDSQKSIEGAGECCSILTADWRDYTQLNRLEKASFRREDNWPFWDLIGILTMPGLVRLKAVQDGQMVGFIGGERETAKRLGWITTLAVLPDYRRRGIAQALLAQAEEELSMARIRLSVRASNAGAIRLYETTGYQQVDRWKKYYAGGEDALVFEKVRSQRW
ncbi:MAG: GNAT family N-acetyltransferase [Chloroflexota bacterium]|nr:GNAT family N-acetyltransferase [Chloroflexota bacterium]